MKHNLDDSMAAPLRVVHVVLSLDAGGLERVVLHLAREEIKQGSQVHVVCVEKEGVLAGEARAMGAVVHAIHKKAGVRLGCVRRLKRLLAEVKPDVVHSHQIGALFYAGLAARAARVPVVVHTEHGKHYENGKRRRWMAWYAARFAQRFYCVSRDIADAVVHWGVASRSKVAVMSNGVETEGFGKRDNLGLRRELGIPANALVIGTVGRLAEVKRQDILLKAFAGLEGQPAPHLLVVGGGTLESELRALAFKLGVADRVHLVGHQAEPRKFLEIMDIFALTSDSEGMPLVVLEAWAAGLPVVASRVGGIPELITNGETGLLFDRGDVQGLKIRLRAMADDERGRLGLGQKGRALVRAQFDVSVMAANYRDAYLKLLEAKGMGGRSESQNTKRAAVTPVQEAAA